MTESSHLFLDYLQTPIGELVLVADGGGRLHSLGFTSGHARMERELAEGSVKPDGVPTRASDPWGLTSAIRRYFDGDLGSIEGLPVAAEGTAFQRAVWGVLREIPCGATWSYGDVARRIGRPAAVRAVGLANGKNPVSIVVPCHRVIGSDRSLTGYGGGIERKRWLLAHEGRGKVPRLGVYLSPTTSSS